MMKKIVLLLIIIVLGYLVLYNLNKENLIVTNEEVKSETEHIKTIQDLRKIENIVFLGDSITEIYPIEEIYGNLPIIKKGISGYTTENILENLEEMVYKYNPTKIFLLIGTNDYKDECDTDKMAEVLKNIKEIVKRIKENRKNAKIYIQSIYPVNRNMDKAMVANRENDIIIKTNSQLKKYCQENDLTYINVYDQLTDEAGNFDQKYTYDGLHPNTMGYARISRILLPYIYKGYTI